MTAGQTASNWQENIKAIADNTNTGAGGGGGAATIADGADVAQGATTDAAGANTVVGQVKQIATNMATQTTLAAAKSDLDTIVTQTSGLATQTTLAAAKTDLDSILTHETAIDTATAAISTNTSNTATAAGGIADAAYTSGSGSIIAVLKGVFVRLANIVTLAFDSTNVLKASLYGKNSAAGDTPLSVDSSGRQQINLAQWNGAAPGVSNPAYVSQSVGSAVAAWGSNPAQTAASAGDTSFKWGASGTTTVNHAVIMNLSSVDLFYAFDSSATSTTAPVYKLASGQIAFWDRAVTALHLATPSQQNIGGQSGIAVEGFA